jgi:hypothetical protein
MNLEDGPFFKICVDSGNQSVTPGAGFAASQSRSEAGDLSALWTPRFAWAKVLRRSERKANRWVTLRYRGHE